MTKRTLISLFVGCTIAVLCLAACDDDDKSTNGTKTPDWVRRDSGTTEHLFDIAWNGSIFVAVGWSVVLTSDDGIDWVSRPLPPEYDAMSSVLLLSVTWSAHHQLFLAAGEDDIIMTSPDGIQWTARESGVSGTLSESVAAFDTLLLVSSENPLTLLTSRDGAAWTRHDGIGPFDAMATSDTLIVGVNGGKVFSSNNGLDWTERHSSDSLLYTVARFAAEATWIAAGHLGRFLKSTDGINWTGFDAGAGEFSTMFGAAGSGDLCIVVGSANGPGIAVTSTDAVQWTATVIESVGWLNGVAASPIRFVAVGDGGVIVTRSCD